VYFVTEFFVRLNSNTNLLSLSQIYKDVRFILLSGTSIPVDGLTGAELMAISFLGGAIKLDLGSGTILSCDTKLDALGSLLQKPLSL
jgi:hypothetical protein